MFAIRRRATLALAQSRPQLLHSVPYVPSRTPCGQRQFSSLSRLQAQYTRFPNGSHYSRRPDRDSAVKIIIFAAAAGVVYVVAHLEQVPETGRWRFMDISPKYEARLEKEAYMQLLSEFEGKILPARHPITHHVHRVVSDLLGASDLGSLHSSNPPRTSANDDSLWHDGSFATERPHASLDSGGKEWKLLVVDDPKIVNALATFDTIVVFTGILPVCQNEAGLAAVLGHEIGHAVARHMPERYSYSKLLIFSAFLLEAVGIDFGVARLLNYLLFKLPNSRTQELEADTLGMRIAARACYDPQSAVEMHTRLAKASETGGVASSFELLRTHPIPKRRIKHLEELVPEAYEIRAASPRCASVRESIEQVIGSTRQWN